ncbi:clathrin heavy chain [Anaeramoeba ignava]|uniref:Clathrin heavy chain n=1 Tax=Anaeramoeba ignava TaxID=1746090 RepID=A0A9Q0LTS9_ANAIG|nr:clathrin heavy chain [Anaeramoeba ignava]
MQQLLPIKITKLFNLTNLGIANEHLRFAKTKMESYKYISVLEIKDNSFKVAIIDLKEPENIWRQFIKADSAIMNPVSKIIALRSQNNLQVFDLEAKSKLKSQILDEEPLFWKWISAEELGIVTQKAVYHWKINDDSVPKLIFNIQQEENTSSQFISYQVSSDQKWCALTGLQMKELRISGITQLYSIDKQVSQILQSEAVSFCDFQVEGATTKTTLLVFNLKTSETSKLHIFELGADQKHNEPKFQKISTDLIIDPQFEQDFPVSIKISEKYSIIYLITKAGFLDIFDLQTGTFIFRGRISNSSIFQVVLDEFGKGFIALNLSGDVFSVEIDEDNFISYISDFLHNQQLANQKINQFQN